MKPSPFSYAAPSSLDEVLSTLAELGEDAKLLAGGQSLVPLLSLRLAYPTALVDLGGVPDLSYIRVDGEQVEIGAMTLERTVERSGDIAKNVPLLSEAMPFVGHPAIRNRGTIGGSAAHADPAAEIPAVAVTSDAELILQSAARGKRTVCAEDFFLGFLTTALEPDEALVSLRIPAARPGTGTAFVEVSRRHGDFAVVGAASVIRLRDGVVEHSRLCLTGVADTPLRRREAEMVLVGAAPSPELFDEAADAASASLEPHSDLHGTVAFRKHLARVLSRRALELATQRAEEAT